MAKKRVVVVGAGPSGLVALKEMLEAGHEATCIERSHVIGGVFSTLKESAYDSLYLTISNVFMAYSDFPCREDYIKYSKKEEYAVYLEEYAKFFKLEEHIKFETNVNSAKYTEGSWTLELKKKDGSMGILNCDSLVVATGSNQVPKKTPDFVKPFKGKIMHSSEFSNAAEFKDKKVLIIGVGESAADIASEISQVAEQATVWSRRPFLIAPRYIQIQMNTKGFDEFTCMQEEKWWRKCEIGDFLEVGTTSRCGNALPMWMYASIRQIIWKLWSFDSSAPASLSLLGKYSRFATAYVGPKTYFRADQSGWVTKNSRLMQMAAAGNVEVVISKSTSFENNTCTFQDVLVHNDEFADTKTKDSLLKKEMKQDYDVVVCCTGYANDFQWLETPQKDVDWCPRTWYKHCWPPGFEKGQLAFIGWARPHQGGIPQTAELCARYHALLLSEERSLPANYADLAISEGQAETDFYILSPHLTSLVDWPSYAGALARMIGCEPKTPSLLFSPITWTKFWVYPLWPCWFRLQGPGAKPDTFKQVMDRFPIAKSKVLLDPITMAIVLPWSFAQKLLLNFLFFPFTWEKADIANTVAFAKSKINVLHGNTIRFSDLFNWST